MTSMPRTFPQVGHFVWTFDNYGIGQLAQIDKDCCTVRFFKSVSDSFERKYEVEQIERAYLSPQTRAYLQDEFGVWSVGRIVDYWLEGSDIWYDIRFPNKIDRRVAEIHLRVRCFLPIDDPASTLAAGGMESQYLHDRRRAALECLVSARANTYGLTGLLSASVSLIPHQVQVVGRVLNDSVQRYLLADEVGLGKTVEACAVIKQAVLDNPEENVLVLAPPSLTGQWIRELAWRFFIERPKHQLRVVPFHELNLVDNSIVNTLVIDEAHNLIVTDSEDNPNYNVVERLALQADRLLLISATPVFGNEKTLLALLHLLDPQTYRLDDEETFREKIQKRQEFGRLLLALDPNQNPFFLRRSLRSLQELIPLDDVVGQFVARVEDAMANGQEDKIASELRALHIHVSDTYRLHQRLIRTRRRDLPGWVLPPRTALLDDLQEDDDERTPLLVDALDQWRQRSLEDLELAHGGADENFELIMAKRYARLHEALGMSVEACAKELQLQLDNVGAGLEPSFEGDQETLEFALVQTRGDTEETRASFATRVVQRALKEIDKIARRPRIVVFGSSTELVLDVATQVESERMAEVFRVFGTSRDEDVIEAIDGFGQASGPAVLICDRRGEEGLNLQFAHGVVHLDLPLAPARIEQRIGRLDRIGRELIQMNGIYHWIVAPYADYFHPWQAWFELLRDGFQVFHRSISEVQFLLDDLQNQVKLALYHREAAGIRDMERQVSEAIVQERQRLDEQYALDSRSINYGDTADVFDAINSFDGASHYGPIDTWISQVLKLGRETMSDNPGDSAFRLHWSPYTLLPKQPWSNLLRSEYLAQPMTYERTEVANRRGLRLVRPGLELVDNLERLLRWDDRGTAFATWRVEPRWFGEGRGTWIGFRLVYVLEADVESVQGTLLDHMDALSLRRRMDSLLPPWTITLDVDSEMKPITDPLLLSILARPYSGRSDGDGTRDYNLGSRKNALYTAIGFPQLSDACMRATQASEELLRNSPQFKHWMDHYASKAVRELYADNDKLERRNEAFLRETGEAAVGIERDRRVNAAIAEALSTPSVRLDALGLFIVSNSPPLVAQGQDDWEDD